MKIILEASIIPIFLKSMRISSEAFKPYPVPVY
jgi:hypothetical protein